MDANVPAAAHLPGDLARPDTSEAIAAALRELILTGQVAPGSPIDEGVFAARFGVSRNSMREGVRHLERLGLVQRARYRMATVATPDAATVDDTFRLRALLELGAIDFAEAIRPTDFSALERALVTLINIDEKRDGSHGQVAADLEFHSQIVALAGSPRLNSMYDQIHHEVQLCLSFVDRWHFNPGDQAAQHQQLYTWLSTGAYSQARRLLSEHISDARSRVTVLLERQTSDLDSTHEPE